MGVGFGPGFRAAIATGAALGRLAPAPAPGADDPVEVGVEVEDEGGAVVFVFRDVVWKVLPKCSLLVWM